MIIKKGYWTSIVFVVTHATYTLLPGAAQSAVSLCSQIGWSPTVEAKAQVRSASIPLQGTDFGDFANHAQDMIDVIVTRLKAEKKSSTLTRHQIGKLRWELYERMTEYKNEHTERSIDREGKRVSARLDRVESECIDGLVDRYKMNHFYSDNDTHTALPLEIRNLINSFLVGNRSEISPLQQELFGTQITNLPFRYEHCIVVSSDNSTVVTASDYTIGIYRFNSNSRSWELRYTINHTTLISSIAVSGDGLVIVTEFHKGTAQIYRFSVKTKCWQLQRTIINIRPVSSVAVSVGGLTVVTGSYDCTAQIHRFNSDNECWELQDIINHDNWVRSIAVSGDGLTVVLGSGEGRAQIHQFDRAQGWQLQHIINHKDWVKPIAISYDGLTVVTGSRDCTAQIHRFNSDNKCWQLQETIKLKDIIRFVTVSRDGATVTIATQNMVQIDRFDRVNGWKIQQIINSQRERIVFVESSSDYPTIIVNLSNDTKMHKVGLSDEKLQEVIAVFTTHPDVVLLLQDIHTKDNHFCGNPVILTQHQLVTLFKLPLNAAKLLIARYHMQLPELTKASLGGATSSGTTETQIFFRNLVAYAGKIVGSIPSAPIPSNSRATSSGTLKSQELVKQQSCPCLIA